MGPVRLPVGEAPSRPVMGALWLRCLGPWSCQQFWREGKGWYGSKYSCPTLCLWKLSWWITSMGPHFCPLLLWGILVFIAPQEFEHMTTSAYLWFRPQRSLCLFFPLLILIQRDVFVLNVALLFIFFLLFYISRQGLWSKSEAHILNLQHHVGRNSCQ